MSDPLPADDGLGSLSSSLERLIERQRSAEAEHERRMREDPAYREDADRRAAERRVAEEQKKRDEEADRRERLTRIRQAKNIPPRFWPFLDRWRAPLKAQVPESVAKAQKWVEKFADGVPGWCVLVLAGPPGVGKTVAAAWFLDRRISGVRRRPPEVTDGNGCVLEWYTERFDEESRGLFTTASALSRASAFDSDFWTALADVDRLVIDDLGCERLDEKGWALSSLTDLLVRRHAHQALTLITTNLSRSAFERRYLGSDGGRLRDRLVEAGAVVEITGPSLRCPLALEEP